MPAFDKTPKVLGWIAPISDGEPGHHVLSGLIVYVSLVEVSVFRHLLEVENLEQRNRKHPRFKDKRDCDMDI